MRVRSDDALRAAFPSQQRRIVMAAAMEVDVPQAVPAVSVRLRRVGTQLRCDYLIERC